MDSHMFDGVVGGLLVIGAVIGVGLCGLVLLVWWLASHVSIQWVS